MDGGEQDVWPSGARGYDLAFSDAGTETPVRDVPSDAQVGWGHCDSYCLRCGQAPVTPAHSGEPWSLTSAPILVILGPALTQLIETIGLLSVRPSGCEPNSQRMCASPGDPQRPAQCLE